MATIKDSMPAGSTEATQIAAFEEYIGHALPEDYRQFLLLHNGGQPVPDAFILTARQGSEENVVLCFFPLRQLSLGKVTVTEMSELYTWPLHCAWDDLQRDLKTLYQTELGTPLLPIGTDGSGNYICIALSGTRVGAVVFLDHETAEDWPLAPSFTAFIESLRPRERADYQ